jgi:hypothetical protein
LITCDAPAAILGAAKFSGGEKMMGLVEQWRERAEKLRKDGHSEIGHPLTYEFCADELEADALYGAAPELLAVTQEAKTVLANMMLVLTGLADASLGAAKIVDGFYEIMDERGHNGIGKRLEVAIAKATGESEE